MFWKCLWIRPYFPYGQSSLHPQWTGHGRYGPGDKYDGDLDSSWGTEQDRKGRGKFQRNIL